MSRIRPRASLLVLTLASLGANIARCNPHLAADATKGQEIAARLCSGCHGLDGKGIAPTIPNLAGQFPEYLLKQLNAFQVPPDGKPLRQSVVMTAATKGLSKNARKSLAAYYSSLPPVSGKLRSLTDIELGRRIYTHGNPTEDLPACITCHRPNGSGIRPDFPRLAAQNADYVDAQLSSWLANRGHRGKLMTMIVPHLSAAERAAVANYVATLRAPPDSGSR